MYPYGSSMNRSTNNVPPFASPGLATNSTQAIPGMPPSAMVSAATPPTVGFAMHQGYAGSVPMGPMTSGPINVQPNQNKMWQPAQQQTFKQQDLHSQQVSQQTQQQKDVKHRDYLKQQQRLKAMPLSSSKTMSADALIGNLLQKKDTFTPRQGKTNKQAVDQPETTGQPSQVRQSGLPVNGGPCGIPGPQDNLPGWLSPSSSRLPPIYSHIWSLVMDPLSGGSLVDTNKILALLLTSGLPKEVLGFIWNLATSGASVQLNQQQLYVTLALVALAQMGCTFNNLTVLNFIPSPPIPTFNMNVPKSLPEDKPKRSDLNAKLSPAVASSTVTSTTPSVVPDSSLTPSFQQVAPTVQNPCTTENDDFTDDFSDFQSADVSHPPSSSSLCTTLPSTAVIQPSIAAKQVVNELNHSVVNKLGRHQGRSIGSRLANYSLGAPKSSQKTRRPLGEYDNTYIQDDLATVERIPSQYQEQKDHSKYQDSSEFEDFSDFQVASGLNVNVDELFPKCHPKYRNQDLILRESSIRNESEDDEVQKSKEEEFLGLTLSAPNTKPPAIDLKFPLTQSEIPVVPLPLPKPTKELMSIEEDKYSALRLIELDSTKNSTTGNTGNVSNALDADDFGDFVSADDLFAEIAVRDTGSSVKQIIPPLHNPVQPSSLGNAEFPIDDWGAQSSQTSQEIGLFNTTSSGDTKDMFDNLTIAFSDLDVTKENSETPIKDDSSSKWSFDFDLGKDSTTLQMKADVTSTHTEDDFGDFVGPDITQLDESNSKTLSNFVPDHLWADNRSNKLVPSVLADNKSISSLELSGVTLSRHGSLPSLDLNLFPTSDDIVDKVHYSQVSDWTRCLESCLALLQAAANTFTNITSHSVVMEVLGTAEGNNYLNNLLEVHRVAWRIQRSYQRSGHESNQIDTMGGGIDKVWSSLQTFYKLANIESAVENDGSDEESGQPACGVCGSPASRSVLEYGGHVYHAPCANLWLNCVDRTLPTHSPLL